MLILGRGGKTEGTVVNVEGIIGFGEIFAFVDLMVIPEGTLIILPSGDTMVLTFEKTKGGVGLLATGSGIIIADNLVCLGNVNGSVSVGIFTLNGWSGADGIFEVGTVEFTTNVPLSTVGSGTCGAKLIADVILGNGAGSTKVGGGGGGGGVVGGVEVVDSIIIVILSSGSCRLSTLLRFIFTDGSVCFLRFVGIC